MNLVSGGFYSGEGLKYAEPIHVKMLVIKFSGLSKSSIKFHSKFFYYSYCIASWFFVIFKFVDIDRFMKM